jgi:predicted nucleic-acid-binding protein
MIGIDTNILVRYITRDDELQEKKARALFLSGPVWISLTVLLETEWVLRSVYRFTREQLSTVVAMIVSSEGVVVESRARIVAALDAFARGVDFADALHLAGCPTETFASFDTALVARAALVFDQPRVISP